MPIYSNTQDRRSPYGRSMANAEADRAELFLELHEELDVFGLADWLATIRNHRFWVFPQERGRDGRLRDLLPEVRYTVAQQHFMEYLWREYTTDWQGSEEAEPHLLDHYYSTVPFVMYDTRDRAVPTGHAQGRDEDTLVEFDSAMDTMLQFVLYQLPMLRILHELDQPQFEQTTLDQVRAAIQWVGQGRATNSEPLVAWLGTWVQYHVRLYIRRMLTDNTPAIPKTSQKSSIWQENTPDTSPSPAP